MTIAPLLRKKNSTKGFSLLELLVVISIIGILIAVGSVAFSTAQNRGRDSKRRSDMQQMQKAFEQYYAQNVSYETCNTMAATDILPAGLPSDPQPSQSYTCNADTTGYCACAQLEGTGTGNASSPSGTSCNFVSDGSGDYFCVSNLQ